MRTLVDLTEPLSPYPCNAKNAQPILIFETENEKMAWLMGSSGAVLQKYVGKITCDRGIVEQYYRIAEARR
jgi:hypothetical protein